MTIEYYLFSQIPFKIMHIIQRLNIINEILKTPKIADNELKPEAIMNPKIMEAKSLKMYPQATFLPNI